MYIPATPHFSNSGNALFIWLSSEFQSSTVSQMPTCFAFAWLRTSGRLTAGTGFVISGGRFPSTVAQPGPIRAYSSLDSAAKSTYCFSVAVFTGAPDQASHAALPGLIQDVSATAGGGFRFSTRLDSTNLPGSEPII